MAKDDRVKPTGTTGPMSFGPAGVQRHFVEFPKAKADIELFIAKLFCAGKAGMRPQINRYGSFENLEQQPEDRPDFTAETQHGKKWLELAEFAPLDEFGHRYENVPGSWDMAKMYELLRALIDKKSAKGYGSDVILVIYKTHETLAAPAPILRAIRNDLASEKVPFEAIYYLSPHDQECASAWEIYPGDPADKWSGQKTGKVEIGFAGFEPG